MNDPADRTVTAQFNKKESLKVDIRIVEKLQETDELILSGPFSTSAYKNPEGSWEYFDKENDQSLTAKGLDENAELKIMLTEFTGTFNQREITCVGLFYNGRTMPTQFKISDQFNLANDLSERELVIYYKYK